MTLRDFFLGGSLMRVSFFGLGIWYCIHYGRTRSLVTLSLAGSIAILILLVFSREWATLIGIPVSALIVWLLTDMVRLEARHDADQGLLHDQHAINEHLITELTARERHSNHRS